MRHAVLLAALLFGCSTSKTDDTPGDDSPDGGVDTPSIELHAYQRGTCALENGHAKCWGWGESGALGDGAIDDVGDQEQEMGDALPVVDVGTDRTVLQISGGSETNCALLDDGGVKCWGWNAHGNLGLGYETVPNDPQMQPANLGDVPGEMGDALPYVKLGTGVSAKALSTGPFHACVITNDDRVKCWGDKTSVGVGDNDHGHLGDEPGDMGDNLPYAKLGEGRTAKQIFAMDTRTCATLDNDQLRCWGNNYGGILGLGNTNIYGDTDATAGDNIPYVDLGAGRTALQVVGGDSHTCALLDDHTVKCWGGGQGIYNQGNLGYGDKTIRGDEPNEMGDNLPVVDLGAGRTAVQLAAGTGHTCALLDDRTVKCWGEAQYGALGYQDPWARGDAPDEMGDKLPAVNLGEGRTALSISAGGTHTCAVLNDQTVKCWGGNSRGILGTGDEQDRGNVPYTMGARLPVTQLGGW
ncbi:MAG TPA: hypothetical protein VGM39_19040 [Kofleriaceae bacterium]|jgi:alpha-tubulin suppressor-like RCC1 family protein